LSNARVSRGWRGADTPVLATNPTRPRPTLYEYSYSLGDMAAVVLRRKAYRQSTIVSDLNKLQSS